MGGLKGFVANNLWLIVCGLYGLYMMTPDVSPGFFIFKDLAQASG